MKQNRRQFLESASLASAGFASFGASSCAEDGDESSLPIIDTHQHLWDVEKFSIPWLAGAPGVLNRSYVTEDFLAATRGLHVVKAIYMEVDVRPEDQVKEAGHVIALSRSPDHPTVAAVISGRPASRHFNDYITGFKDTPEIKGVRQVLQVPETPQGFCLAEPFVKSVRLLGELGKSFDICIRPSELADGVRLAAECPDTLCIVDHCGNADPKAWIPEKRRGGEEPWHEVNQWKRDMEAMAKRENAICKISGIVARAPKGDWSPEDLAGPVDFCLDAFGPDRVIFGGDWPVCNVTATYRDWVGALKEIIASRPREDQRKLLHDNAVKHYRLA